MIDEEIVDDELTKERVTPRVKLWLAMVLLVIFIQGLIFKVLHLPFADYLRLLPIGVWLGYSSHYLLLRKDKSVRNISSMIIVLAYLAVANWYSEEYYIIGITTVVAFFLTFAWKDK